MQTMKALVYHGAGDVRYEDIPRPVPSANEVLIRVKAVSICGSDLGAYKTNSDRFKAPLILGHEFSGVIEEVGKDVKDLSVGRRVTVNPILYCGNCYFCKQGMINFCNNRASLGTRIGGVRTDGAMAEYVCIREPAVIPLDDRVSFIDAALLEPLAVTVNCAQAGGAKPGETVAVIGTGPIGLMTVKFLKARNAGKIIVTDIVENRLKVALKCGAHFTVNSREQDTTAEILKLTDGVGVDRVIICGGPPSIVAESFGYVRTGGSIILVSLIHHNIELDPIQIVGRAISIIGSYMYAHKEIPEAMRQLAEKKIDVQDIITSVRPLSEGADAFEKLAGGSSGDIKVILTV